MKASIVRIVEAVVICVICKFLDDRANERKKRRDAKTDS